jgi:hypothetical protein
MSTSVLCHGCGGRVAVPDDYSRARIRCPACGVLCDVPATAGKKAAPAARPAPRQAEPAETAAAEALLQDEPAPARPQRKKTPASEEIQPRLSKVKPAAVPPPPPYPTEYSSEDDGKPYYVQGLEDERPCPECRKMIPRDALLCTSCGFNLQTGKKAVQVYEPVDRSWHGGWPLGLRLGVFLGCQAVIFPLMLLGAWSHGRIFGWFFPWLFFTAMTAFLLGTFDQIHLKRNKKGRVTLTKTWRLCFIPRPPVEVDVHTYSGVVYGQKHEISWMDMFILVGLIVSGIIPGLIWFYLVFLRETVYVALAKAHGYPDLILYQGGNQELMREIAETIGDVAHMPAGSG